MPLPKTASIAARATEVYSDVWSMLLQKCWGLDQGKEEQEMADLSLLLPYLRQLLTCCACAGLLEDAMISLVCGHCYCYECQFRTPLLKIQCRQCRERRGLVIENQIRLLVNCYKRMCLILASEIHDNPLVLTIVGENPTHSETNEKDKQEACVENGKEKQEESVENGGVKETTNGEVEAKNDQTIPESFNPIAEILKEVQEGKKVSRAVLVIKPPSRYINARPMPTPKKDQSVSAKVAAAAASTDQPEKEAENKVPEDTAVTGGGGGGGGESGSVKKKRGRKAKRQLTLTLPSEEKDSSENEKEPVKAAKVSKEKEKSERKAEPLPRSATLMEADLLKAKVSVDNLKPIELEVSARSVDSQFMKISNGGIVVKNKVKEREVEMRGEYVADSTATMLQFVRFALDKDGNRRRVWNPLCPKVVVRRSRASIDKMRNLQTRTVGARLRSKEKKKKAETPPLGTPTRKEGKKSQEVAPVVPQEAEEETMEMDHQTRLEQLEREHGLQLPDLDTNLDPDLELDASWLEELCEGIDEDLMYFTQPPVPPPLPPPPSMPFPPSSTPPHHPPMFGPPYSPQHHLPPPPHHFSPHHPPPGFMHHPLHPPPPHHHHFMPRHHHHPLPPPPPPPPPPPRIPQRPPMPPHGRPPPIKIHHPPSPRSPIFPFRTKHQLPVIVGKMNVNKNPAYSSKPLLSPQGQTSKSKKRRSPGYSESGWRCRCGTNNVMFPEKVCAKGKCPCYSKGIPCKNCLCRKCHNPFNNEEEDSEATDQPEVAEQPTEMVM